MAKKTSDKVTRRLLLDSENINKARKWATEHNKTLSLLHDDFDYTVIIVHQDGSTFTYQFAFALNLWDEFIAVFHEHSAPAVFFKADLLRYDQYKTMKMGYEPMSSLKNVK